MKARLRATFPIFLAALFSGCLAHHEVVRFTAPDYDAQAPAKVIVLPFDNYSTDLLGPELLRTLVSSELRASGYDPQPIPDVDEKLRTIGITDGGQLRSVRTEALNKTLDADGLIYGVVEEFAFLNVGFAIRRVVRLHLRFVRASTGATQWEDTEQGLTEWFTLNKKDAERALMEGILEKAIETAFHTPLMPESKEAIRLLFLRLPRKVPIPVAARS